MALSLGTTIAFFFIPFFISIFCGIASIILLQNTKKEEKNELYYVIMISLGAGISSLVFRIFAMNVQWIHFSMHTVSLAVVLWSRKKIVDRVTDGKWRRAFEEEGMDFMVMALYAGQYILGLHLMVFRYGRTKPKRLFRSGLHAFLGCLVLFACITGACCRLHIFPATDNDSASDDTTTSRIMLMFAYGALVWFLVLHPQFDWRRVEALKKRSSANKPQRVQPVGRGRKTGSARNQGGGRRR